MQIDNTKQPSPMFKGGPPNAPDLFGGAAKEDAPSLQGALDLLQKAVGMISALKAKEAGPDESAPVEAGPPKLRPPMTPR